MKWVLRVCAVAAVVLLSSVVANDGAPHPATRTDASPQIYLVDVRTGEMTSLTDSGSSDEPAFSPDGRTIAFACLFPDTNGLYVDGLCTMRPDGSARTMLTSLFDRRSWINDPVWSPNGTKIAFSVSRPCEFSNCGLYSLYVINADGSGLHEIASGSRNASWSPDSRRLVFEAGITPDGIPHEIRTARADGVPIRRVVTGQVWEPRWSPSGRWIVYSAGVYDESYGVDNRHVWVKNLATGRRRQFGRGHEPSWSPRGDKFVFSRYPGGGAYVASLTSSRLQRIDTLGLRPAFSPDGRMIAYWRRLALRIAAANGKHNRVITRLSSIEEGPGSSASWSSEATKIVFAGTK